jgi:hypothetical protein
MILKMKSHFIHSLSHFELAAGIALHLNYFKQFSISTFGAIVSIQTYLCLGEFL